VDVEGRDKDDAGTVADHRVLRLRRVAANVVRRHINMGARRPLRLLAAGALLFAGASTAWLFAVPSSASPTALGRASCGVERWGVKTLTDKEAASVNLKAKTTSVRALRRLRRPTGLRYRGRIFGVETTTYRVRAVVVEMKLEEDDDIHLVIAQPGATSLTMIVEFPAYGCTRGAPAPTRAAMRSARAALVRACGTPTRSSFTQLRGAATITGVGFFDLFHGQTGVAPNGIELHPVLTATRIVCRPGTPPPPPPTTTVAPPTTTAPPPPTTTAQTTTVAGNCAPSYPDVCIAPPPPDLDCGDIPFRNFRVIYTVPDPDPHRFDADHDGIGCES
jgi:hypothetical protein